MKFNLNEGTGKFIMYAAIGILLILVVRKYFLKKSDADKAAVNEVDALQREIDKRKKAGVKPTWNEAKYLSLANKLYTAVKGTGTDEQTVKSVFTEIKSMLDLLLLKKAFGVRDGMTLVQWITEDMSAEDVHEYVNRPLLSNNVGSI